MTLTPHLKHVILACLAAGLILVLTWKIMAHMDGTAHDANVLAQQQLKQDQQAQKAEDIQAQKDSDAYQILKTQLDSQNAALKAQLTSLAASLNARQAQDRALPIPEVGNRIETLVGALPEDVKASLDGLILNESASRKTVVMLEEVPADRQTIQNQGTMLTNKDSELVSLQTSLNSSREAENSCKTTQVAEKSACDAQIKEVKASARKRSFWWSLGSFIGGIVLGRKI